MLVILSCDLLHPLFLCPAFFFQWIDEGLFLLIILFSFLLKIKQNNDEDGRNAKNRISCRMIANSTSVIGPGGNACLNIMVDLKTDDVEGDLPRLLPNNSSI